MGTQYVLSHRQATRCKLRGKVPGAFFPFSSALLVEPTYYCVQCAPLKSCCLCYSRKIDYLVFATFKFDNTVAALDREKLGMIGSSTISDNDFISGFWIHTTDLRQWETSSHGWGGFKAIVAVFLCMCIILHIWPLSTRASAPLTYHAASAGEVRRGGARSTGVLVRLPLVAGDFPPVKPDRPGDAVMPRSEVLYPERPDIMSGCGRQISSR